jgi:hypothetical protein
MLDLGKTGMNFGSGASGVASTSLTSTTSGNVVLVVEAFGSVVVVELAVGSIVVDDETSGTVRVLVGTVEVAPTSPGTATVTEETRVDVVDDDEVVVVSGIKIGVGGRRSTGFTLGGVWVGVWACAKPGVES